MTEYEEIEKLVEDLYLKDTKAAYESLRILEAQSQKKDLVYSFTDRFAEMMEDENSYIRTRGLLLIAANAKWDQDNKLDELIDTYLKHILDEKAITARQCIKALPQIAMYKHDLKESILQALKAARPELKYRDSMFPLVRKDIEEALKKIEKGSSV